MAENGRNVRVKPEICIISSDDEDKTPIRPLVCIKKSDDLKRYEETEDCFILDFDPNEPIDASNTSVSSKDDECDSEIEVVFEKGQVACRDYPHARHLCLKFPFTTTPHQSYCDLCYCYVCDEPAPCQNWTVPEPKHCDASEKGGDGLWKRLRFWWNKLE
ncbi:hypothetical protein UlMin_045719 [Ulmus minor]